MFGNGTPRPCVVTPIGWTRRGSGRFRFPRNHRVGALDEGAQTGVVVVGHRTEPGDAEAGDGGGERRPGELLGDRSGEAGLGTRPVDVLGPFPVQPVVLNDGVRLPQCG